MPYTCIYRQLANIQLFNTDINISSDKWQYIEYFSINMWSGPPQRINIVFINISDVRIKHKPHHITRTNIIILNYIPLPFIAHHACI